MNLKAVKRYKEPKYPDKTNIKHHPKTLKRLPKRWKSNIFVISTLAFVLTAGELYADPGDNGVAPVFTHGEGVDKSTNGLMGLAEATPRYIGSVIQNAEQFIDSILASEGIHMTKDGQGSGVGIRGEEILLDSYDVINKIGYEFVSKEDVYNWSEEFCEQTNTIRTASLLDQHLRRVNKDEDRYIGVFYEPLSPTLPQSKYNLKQQVLDFIEWLKAQGAL